jgi:uncharacterized protein
MSRQSPVPLHSLPALVGLGQMSRATSATERVRHHHHRCPGCRGEDVERATRHGLLEFVVLPLLGRRRYRCLACDHRFFDRPSNPPRDLSTSWPHSTIHSAGLGLFSGFASGVLGGGGGLLIVPGLILGGRVSIQRAVGAAAVTISLTSLVAVLTMATIEHLTIDWWILGLLTAGSLVGSTAAGRFLTRRPDKPIRVTLSMLLVFAAFRLVTTAPTSGLEGVVWGGSRAVEGAAMVVVGMLAGLVSVLCGIGGSLIVVPALSLIAPGLPFDIIRGTSLAVPSSALAVYQHLRRGTVDLRIVRPLGSAATVGVVAGVIVGSALPAQTYRVVFAGLLVLIGLGLAMPTREPTRNRLRWFASPKPLGNTLSSPIRGEAQSHGLGATLHSLPSMSSNP